MILCIEMTAFFTKNVQLLNNAFLSFFVILIICHQLINMYLFGNCAFSSYRFSDNEENVYWVKYRFCTCESEQKNIQLNNNIVSFKQCSTYKRYILKER
jgi:hypothetical protein